MTAGEIAVAGSELAAEAGVWPGVADPAELLGHVAAWLAGYGNHATRRTYAEGLGLPVTAADLRAWTRGPGDDGWRAAVGDYADALTVDLGGEASFAWRARTSPGTTAGPRGGKPSAGAPPPASRGRFRGLHWFRWCASHGVDPVDARSGQVKAWLDVLAVAGAAPATRDRMLATVKSLYAHLADAGVATGNPAALDRRRLGLAVSATSASSTVTLTARQVRALYTTAGTPRSGASPVDTARAVAVVALFTLGLRVSELCALDRHDLHVTRGRRALRVHGKGGKTRIVYLSEPAEAALTAYLSSRDAKTTALARRTGTAPEESEPLLLNRNGRRYQRQAVWQLLRRLAVAAGAALADVAGAMHPHALRHFYVTTAVEAGAQLVHVQADVGHSSIDTTQQTYDHAARDPARSAVDLVADSWYRPEDPEDLGPDAR